MSTRRKFLTTGALGGAAALAAPAVGRAQDTIRWRMQTYAGTSLGAQVVKPAVDMFNAIAGDEMQIDLFYADQLVPTGELSRPCSAAPSTPCSPTTIPWPRPRRSPCSAATSPSPAVIRSMFRHSSTTGGEFQREVQHRWRIRYPSVAKQKTVLPCQNTLISPPLKGIGSPL